MTIQKDSPRGCHVGRWVQRCTVHMTAMKESMLCTTRRYTVLHYSCVYCCTWPPPGQGGPILHMTATHSITVCALHFSFIFRRLCLWLPRCFWISLQDSVPGIASREQTKPGQACTMYIVHGRGSYSGSRTPYMHCKIQ